MRFKQQTALLTTCIFITTLFASIGCKSGAFKKPDFAGIKKPDLSGLAFWKKEPSAEMPPPPSHRFDPAPGGGEQKMARLDSTIEQGGGDIQDSFNRMVMEANKQKKELAQKPIRTPYSMSEKNISAPAEIDNNNSFDIANTNSKIEMPNLDSSVQKAQQDFQAALAGSSNAIKGSLNSKAKDTVSTWKNDYELPAKIAQSQQKINPEDLKINRKLYDMSGNLSSGAKSAVNQFANASQDIQARVDSGFEVAQVSLAQQQIAELKRQLAVGQANSAAPTMTTQPNLGNQQPTNHVASLLMPNSQSNGSTQPANGNFSPVQGNTMPQNLMPPMTAQISSNQSGNAKAPAYPNVLRTDSQYGTPAGMQSTAPTTPTGRLQPQTQPTQGQYPATPHGGYSSPSLSKNQFGGSSTNDFAATQKSQVINADSASAIQAGTQSGVSTASHVSDIEIPAAILQGSGSYAPGSVNPLSQQK